MNQLQKFQEKHGLKPDGIIGPVTLSKMKEIFGIDTNEKLAHFVGQVIHETGNFRYEVENLNYSVTALKAVFGKYFTEKELYEYANKPEKIANRVYGNRMGNGNEASGDGWKHRGRGAIQLTGKNNYEKFSEYVGDDEILCDPEIIVEKYFFECALFFFTKNNLWDLCEEVTNETIIKVTRRINGGINGYQDRIMHVKKIYGILCR